MLALACLLLAMGTNSPASADTTAAGFLPMLWKGCDIGAVGVSGSASDNEGTYTVIGSGADIGGTADALQFASQNLAGDGEIRARIASQTNTNAWAKAGVMIRDGTSAGAVNVLVALTPGNGFSFQSRTTSGGATTTSGSAAANAAPNNWVRLLRIGTTISGYVSSNGTSWTQIGTSTVGMASTVSFGLAVASHGNTALSTAVIDNVSVTPWWQTMDIGSTGKTGSVVISNGTFTVNGAGTVGSTSDKFRFVYQVLTGTTGQIIARISTLQNTSSSARLGLMIRSGTATNSTNAFMGVSGAGAYKFQTRSSSGGNTTTSTGGTGTTPNIWVKLVRSGNSFSGYSSSDGLNWTQVGSTTTIAMTSTSYFGIVDASGNTTTLNTSVFDNVIGSITALPLITRLNSFEDASLLASIQDNAICTLSGLHVTDGTASLQVTFPYYGNPIEYPGAEFPAGTFFSQTDWSHTGAFMFDAYNAESAPLLMAVRIHGTDGSMSDVTVTLPPGVPQRVVVGLHLPYDVLMNGYPLNQACNADQSGLLPAWSGFTGASVASIQFFLDNPGRAYTAYFDNFTLADIVPPCNIVDQYGQYTQAEWPGKIHSDSELVTAHNTEAATLAAQLAALQTSTDRDAYGGWAAGTTLAATGWFRTQKLNGTWWLVTPTGHLFWSTGIDNANADTGTVVDDTNRQYFTSIPSAASNPFDPWGIDFYYINLNKAYGSGYLASWLTSTANRMKVWGFNTLGAWCDAAYGQIQTPFTVALNDGTGATFDGGNGTLSDFYSTAWKTDVEAQISAGTGGSTSWKTNPLCIGYFVNNEQPPWSGADYLPVNALALSGTWAVKAAFTTILQNEYGTISALNAAWGISVADWASFQANPVTLPAVGSRSPALQADLSALLSAFANQYFSTVAALVKKYAPDQLYLGTRFGAVPPDEVAVAAGKYCDVVAYNAYGLGAPPYGSNPLQSRDRQIRLFDKPVMIGEFSFGALDRGLFSEGVRVASQQDRATQYAAYVNSALSQSWCVGVHWFQYIDEAITGRGDGENANEGLVTVCDLPYPELVGQATITNAAMYSTRNGVAMANPIGITPSAVSGSSAILSVTGGDVTAESGAIYTWTTTGTTAGTVAFTPNGTVGAQNTTMTFSQPGMIPVLVTVTGTTGHMDTCAINLSPDVWINASGGNWSNGANWSGGVVANGTDSFAIFSTLNLTSNATVTLDGAVIAGNLLFADSTPSNTWSLSAGTGGALTLSVSAGSPIISVADQTAAIGAVIAGNQGFCKTGTGTLVVSGSNIYTGATTVSGGILRAGTGPSAFGSNSAVTLSNAVGATLDLNGFNNSIGSLAGGGPLGGNVTMGTATLTAGGNDCSTVFAGIISGAGGITKTGAGTWTLSGSNSYTGATVVDAGTLQAGVATSAFGYNSAVSLGNVEGTTLDLNGFSNAIGSLAGGGTVNLGSATLTTGANNTSTEFAGAMSGGNVTKTGTGTWMLSGTNALGALYINDGLLVIDGGATKASGWVDVQGDVAGLLIQSGSFIVDGGILVTEGVTSSIVMTGGVIYLVNGWSDGHSIGNVGTTASLNLSGTSAMTVVGSLNIGTRAATSVTVGEHSTLTVNGFNFGWYGNQLEAGGSVLTVTGSGLTTINQRLALNGGNGTETINLDGGTVQTVASDRANTGGTIILNFNGGTLKATGSGIGGGSLANFLAGVDAAIVKAGGAIVDTNGNDLAISNALVSGTAGDGGLKKLSAGTLTLSGACNYNGATTVNAGKLQVIGSVASGGGVIISPAATLGGTGLIAGPVAVNGILAPGAGDIGSMTVANALSLSGTTTMRISKSGSTTSNDSVTGMASVTYGGKLIVTDVGGSALAAGDTFILFSAAAYSHSFSGIVLPSLSGSLVWNTSNLAINGSISVKVPSPPISLKEMETSSAIVLSSSTGTLNFQSSVVGHTYQLQTVDSLTSGTWANVGAPQNGTGVDLHFAIPYDRSVSRRFYRLQIQQ